MTVIAAFCVNAGLNALQRQLGGDAFRTASVILNFLFFFGGIACGIIALCGVRRYGRRGLLVPSLIGLGIWLLLTVLSIPIIVRAYSLSKALRLQPLVQSSNAKRVDDAVRGFSFELPDGYTPTDPAILGGGFSHGFVREVPDEMRRVLVVKPLNGFITHERLKAENLPKDSKSTIGTFNWRGVTVDGVRIPEEAEGQAYVTWNVQIPLRPRAIQISVGGPESAEPEIRQTIDKLLSTLDGQVHP